jgi:putative transcriptional regulator
MAVIIRLRELRKRQGYSQNKLAKATGMSLQGLQRYEYGKAATMPLDTLDKFCRVLNCTPGDILQYAPDPQKEEEALAESK